MAREICEKSMSEVNQVEGVPASIRRILIERIYAGRGFRRARRNRSMVLRVPAPEGGVRLADPAGANVVDMIALSEQTADG